MKSVARAEGPTPGTPALVVREAPFERRVLLSGDIDAVSIADMKVPRVQMGKVSIRWLEVDGAQVKKGDKLVELDNAAFAAVVKDKELAASQAEIDLKRQEWQNGLLEADKQLDVERKKALLRRAEIDADVPVGILPKRDYLEKQLALRKARAELEKAEEALIAHQKTAALDVELRRIALGKAQREVKLSESFIKELTIRAPADGTVIIGDHWEGRKLQVADDVFVGTTLARMPDLTQIRVRAWLSDVDDGRIAPGMPAEVTLDAFPEQRIPANVVDIAPVAREPSDRSLRRVFQVTVSIAGPERSDLRPGMSARVEVIADRRDKARLVPRAALSLTGDRPTAALADGKSVPVTLGPCNAQDCIAAAGLELGTRVRKVAP